MEDRNELFQRLKPPCVAVGQAALALNGTQVNGYTATDELDKIRRILSSATSLTHNALDAKLAEYVFFPIAQLLKASQKLSIRALELCLQCITILVEKGWRQDIPASLTAQLLILCTMLAEKSPKGLSFSETTGELQASSFWCMYHLFFVVALNAETAKMLRSETNFPQLGQTFSTILDGIYDGGSVEAQVAATNALDALVMNVADIEAQASFLPGIVSKLTKVLTPQTKSRRNHTVLVRCLSIFVCLLKNTMSDSMRSQSRNNDETKNTIIDAKWQDSAATRLRPALSNILRLKSHSRADVKSSVAQLCLTVLQYCRETLENCSRMTLEVLLTLSTDKNGSDTARELVILMRMDPSLSMSLQNQLYDWLQSLSTVMQGSDEQVKAAKLEQIVAGYGLLKETHSNTDMIDRLFAKALRDCVVVTLNVPNSKHEPALLNSQIQTMDVEMLKHDTSKTKFSMPLVKYKGQEDILGLIERLSKQISRSMTSANFVGDLARRLQQSQGEEQIANFWLLQIAVENMLHHKTSVDDLLNLDDETNSTVTEYLEELYSFSLSILSDSPGELYDSRFHSLALRSLALRAQGAGQEFRYELVDALYPVLHTLATPETQLQRDSIAALNIFSTACGYTSVKQLIVDNVDYLTNAVALKLNAFDVSPQAPQVLLMMVRLAGPSLLPYLEDTIDSIFAALENYHGYPLLVELLFQVLSVVADEGARAPLLAITNGGVNFVARKLDEWRPTTVDNLSALLQRRAIATKEASDLEKNTNPQHPKTPWKEINRVQDSGLQEADQQYDNYDVHMEDAEVAPPAAKTYNLLLKINDLTQHFLPSSSPSLRSRLLNLIKATVPAMAKHENSFLPLINTLWPEIVARLDDEEQYIVASAVDVIGVLCEYAGDFMRTRVAQIWPRLREIYQNLAKELVQSVSSENKSYDATRTEHRALISTSDLRRAVHAVQTSPATYSDTGVRLLWPVFIKTLSQIVVHTGVSPEMFDEALEMAGPVLEQSAVRTDFERENADAVWLCAIQAGHIARPVMPIAEIECSWQFAKVPR